MTGRFVLQYREANGDTVWSEAFETEEDARVKAEEAPDDVDVWLVPVVTAKAILVRKRTTESPDGS